MSAILRAFTPTFTKAQSQQKLQKLLTAGKNKRYYADTEGAVRYVVADNGEKGLTFAVEPIKLALSDALEGGELMTKSKSLSRENLYTDSQTMLPLRVAIFLNSLIERGELKCDIL